MKIIDTIEAKYIARKALFQNSNVVILDVQSYHQLLKESTMHSAEYVEFEARLNIVLVDTPVQFIEVGTTTNRLNARILEKK